MALASLNFLIWGLYHGLFVIMYSLTSSYWDKLKDYMQIFLTFLIVSLAWPLFDLSTSDLIYIFQKFSARYK